MHTTGICLSMQFLLVSTKDSNSEDYRENIKFMYVHLWATQSMTQEIKIITNKTVKTKDLMIIQVLN